ncbi:LysR family transcriptional regulator [Rhodococcus chondri]|uniref:LysR family transcriptional regulator n=1 Tax=Rhodococcus chondri TaxID=3065941 RepID=A0ABU7JPR1_9NOCA|nr:LysR family transcriptional regulator [Rhodococcus sp. CC-R104]MEE2032018.1 LysR family transcriptional regulator [Rhodococcus sp. CC-R104]
MVELRRVDLNLLVVLDVLLAECNVTNAARRLNMSQPATSTALARLRKQLDDPLLVKSGRGLRPTPRAQALVEPLRSVLTTVERSILTAPDFDPASDTRAFTLLAGDYAEIAMLRALMKRSWFNSAHVRFDMVPRSVHGLQAFHRHEIDLAVLPEQLLGASGFEQCRRRLVLADRFVGAVWSGHPYAGSALTPEVLARYPMLSYVPFDEDTGLGRVLARAGIVTRVRATSSNVALMPYALEKTHMVALIPKRMAERLTDSACLRVLEPTFELPPVREYAVWHEDKEADPAHAWLRGQLATGVTGPVDETPDARPERDGSESVSEQPTAPVPLIRTS